MNQVLRLARPACAALALGWLARVAAADALPKGSPFMPAGSDAAAAVAPNEVIEFAAVRTIGNKTEINLYDTQGKKSHWIGVGATADGMTVLGYDQRRDQVTAKIGGTQKVLPLRRSKAGAGGIVPMVTQPAMGFNTPPPQPVQMTFSPAPAANSEPAAVASAPLSAPTQPAPTPEAPKQPLSVARQEEEARMLVSDLLEIGMAQRKAYEEKQRQAADPNAAQATPPPATPAPNPNGPPSGAQP